MRRLLPLLLATTALCACGGDEEGGSSASPPPTTAATTGEPAPTTTRSGSGAPRVSTVATGLEVPWDIAFLPDRRALVTERPGRVRLVSADGELRDEPVARVPVQAEGEGGLMGIAIDPEFEERPFAYVYVTTSRGLELQRWRVAEDGTMERDGLVLDGIDAGRIHDSGRIRFGPDDHLYVLTGDAGDGDLAQQGDSLNGKVLRLTPRQYRSSTSRPEIVSSGHRNPQGLDWQPGSDRLYAAEHGASGFDGPSGDDELNLVRAGENYGWPEVRGEDHGRFEAPAFNWSRTIAPSGIAFVDGDNAWEGDLLVAALKGEALHRLTLEGERVTDDEVLLRGRYGRLRAVEQAPDGSIWVTTSNRDTYGSPVTEEDDKILRITPPS